VAGFTGIDGKSYGPSAKGENAVIPKENAERLAGEGLASRMEDVFQRGNLNS